MDKKKILVVDDEQDMLLMLENLLTCGRYTVFTASNGRDAIALAKSKCPDVIILDLAMPDMDGSEVAEVLNECPETENIPIMFLTGLYSKREEDKMGRVVGNCVCLAKPCNGKELLGEIRKLIPKGVAT